MTTAFRCTHPGSTPRVNDIAHERRGFTADTALQLARYFGTDAQSWLNCKRIANLK